MLLNSMVDSTGFKCDSNKLQLESINGAGCAGEGLQLEMK